MNTFTQPIPHDVKPSSASAAPRANVRPAAQAHPSAQVQRRPPARAKARWALGARLHRLLASASPDLM